MRTLIQKVLIDQQQSFACRTYTTPDFETNWHKHEEHELILILQGYGTLMLGDYIGEYKEGDVFFIAGNLPHWFRKQQPKMIASVLVVHFRKEIFGDGFLALPELQQIEQLLKKPDGIQLQKSLLKSVEHQMLQIEKAKGFSRMSLLLHVLQEISHSKQCTTLAKNFFTEEEAINPAIEKIFQYTFNHYLQPITLEEVATISNMTIPTFCRFFKRNVKKTYFDFLKEIRIGHACDLLQNSNKPIMEICFESGYNSWAHFSKQFREVKNMPPGKYRKSYLS